MSEQKPVHFDEIWKFIEQELKNAVPPYFKYILNYCGYNNGISIASIEDEDIQYFISQVRNGNVTNYFKAVIGETNVLEGSMKTAENFDFSRGHLKYLMHIVSILKTYIQVNGTQFTNEVASKTKPKKSIQGLAQGSKIKLQKLPSKRRTKDFTIDFTDKPQHNLNLLNQQHCTSTVGENYIEKQKNILIKKMLGSLATHTPRLYAENNSEINEKMSTGKLIVVEVYKQNTQYETFEISEEMTNLPIYTASMFCPYCSKKINVFYVSGRAPRWNSSNFDRHLRHTHPQNEHRENDNEETHYKSEDQSGDVKTTEANYLFDKTTGDGTRAEKMSDGVAVAIDDNKNAKTVGAVATDVIDYNDNDSILIPVIPCSQSGENSKNIVCYSDSNDSDYDVDEQDNKNSESEQSKTLASKDNEPDRNNYNSMICHSLILPKPGDFIFFSKLIENSEKWPENTPVKKDFVGQVYRIKDNIWKNRENTMEIIKKKSECRRN